MAFKGFGVAPGNVKIEAWPSGGLETATSYVVYCSGMAVFHVSDVLTDENLAGGTVEIVEGARHSFALQEPTHLIYPSATRKKSRVVERRMDGEAINDLHIYPQSPRRFYFMVGELHCLLHGPGTFLLNTEQEPVGPYGPTAGYSDLEVFKLINQFIDMS